MLCVHIRRVETPGQKSIFNSLLGLKCCELIGWSPVSSLHVFQAVSSTLGFGGLTYRVRGLRVMNPGKVMPGLGFSPERSRSEVLVGLGKVGFGHLGSVLASFMST